MRDLSVERSDELAVLLVLAVLRCLLDGVRLDGLE